MWLIFLLEENLEKSLRDTNQSLARMEKGEYGICKYCHKPIEEKDYWPVSLPAPA